MRLTRAVTPIRLCAANHTKVAALDTVAAAYMALCQQYVTHFCVEAEPDGYAAPCFPSPLSQRWQRVAIQQAAGIAKSWRTNPTRPGGLRRHPRLLAGRSIPEEYRWSGPLADADAQADRDQANANVALGSPVRHLVCLLAADLDPRRGQ